MIAMQPEQQAWLDKHGFKLSDHFAYKSFPREGSYRNPEALRLGREAHKLGFPKTGYTHQSCTLVVILP